MRQPDNTRRTEKKTACHAPWNSTFLWRLGGTHGIALDAWRLHQAQDLKLKSEIFRPKNFPHVQKLPGFSRAKRALQGTGSQVMPKLCSNALVAAAATCHFYPFFLKIDWKKQSGKVAQNNSSTSSKWIHLPWCPVENCHETSSCHRRGCAYLCLAISKQKPALWKASRPPSSTHLPEFSGEWTIFETQNFSTSRLSQLAPDNHLQHQKYKHAPGIDVESFDIFIKAPSKKSKTAEKIGVFKLLRCNGETLNVASSSTQNCFAFSIILFYFALQSRLHVFSWKPTKINIIPHSSHLILAVSKNKHVGFGPVVVVFRPVSLARTPMVAAVSRKVAGSFCSDSGWVGRKCLSSELNSLKTTVRKVA